MCAADASRDRHCCSPRVSTVMNLSAWKSFVASSKREIYRAYQARSSSYRWSACRPFSTAVATCPTGAISIDSFRGLSPGLSVPVLQAHLLRKSLRSAPTPSTSTAARWDARTCRRSASLPDTPLRRKWRPLLNRPLSSRPDCARDPCDFTSAASASPPCSLKAARHCESHPTQFATACGAFIQ